MATWQVVAEYRLTDSIEEACQRKAIPFRVWHLEDHPTGRKLAIRLTVAAHNLVAAMTQIQDDLGKLQGIAAESELTSLRFHVDGTSEQIPELVGLADIAKMLEVSRQRAKQLADGSRNFPQPLARTPSTGNLYARHTILSWIEHRDQALNRNTFSRNDFPVQPLTSHAQSESPPDWLVDMFTDRQPGGID